MNKLILTTLVIIIFFGLFSPTANAHIGERATPSQGVSSMPMMQMMGNWGMPMMSGAFGWGNTSSWLNLITYLLTWAFLILAIIALVKWISKK